MTKRKKGPSMTTIVDGGRAVPLTNEQAAQLQSDQLARSELLAIVVFDPLLGHPCVQVITDRGVENVIAALRQALAQLEAMRPS